MKVAMIQPKHAGWLLLGMFGLALLGFAVMAFGLRWLVGFGALSGAVITVVYVVGLTVENEWRPWRWVVFN